jgi:hypothetical protein
MKTKLKILLKVLFITVFLNQLTLNAQILKDTVTLNQLKKGIDYIYNFQFREADVLYQKISESYPEHPIVLLFKGLEIYWQSYPMVPTSSACGSYEEVMKRCIDLCDKKVSVENSPENLLTNLCGRGLLLQFYADNNMSLEVFPLASSTYPFVKQAFKSSSTYADLYFFTGLYNYYREAYPETYPIYKSLAFLFPHGDKVKGIKEIQNASLNAIVLKAESFSFLSGIYLDYENNFTKATFYSKTLTDLYPGNLLYMGEYIKNLLLIKKYDDAEKLIKTYNLNTKNKYFQGQLDVFNGILYEKKYFDKTKAEQFYNKGIRAISLYGVYGNEYMAYAYFGLSRISSDIGEKHYKRTYHKLASKLAVYKKIDFAN